MKSNYVTPEVMVLAFNQQDVITASSVLSTPETTRNFNSAWLD